VLPSIRALLQRPVSVRGHVTDALTGRPLAATLTYVGVPFIHGETNGSDARWGRYHAFLPDGVHFLKFTVDGYHPRYYRIKVGPGGGQVLDVPLMPVSGGLGNAILNKNLN